MKIGFVVFTVILVISLLIGIQVVEMADANPFLTWKEISPPLDATPPIISINSPQNSSTYSEEFDVNFSVRPAQYGGYSSNIVEVSYTIDNVTVTPFSIYQNWSIGGLPQYSTVIRGPFLSAGNHSLRVWVLGATYLLPNREVFFVNSSSQVFFNLSENHANEGSPSDGSVMVDLNATSVVIIASSVVIVAVASVSLVYFMREREKKRLNFNLHAYL
jgi:hypothetical protein